MEGKFSTKRYKEFKFPHLKGQSQEEGTEPVLQILKNTLRKEDSKKEIIRNWEKTPEKHQVLKMKKLKSKKNVEGQSVRSTSSLNIFSNNSENVYSTSQLNEEETVAQDETPIAYFQKNRKVTPPIHVT